MPSSLRHPLLRLELDRGADASALTDQLCRAITLRIGDGGFAAGVRMPSVRQLASHCGVSPYTVSHAYDQLVAQGLLQARKGSGFYVRERPDGQPAASAPPRRGADVFSGWRLRLMREQASSDAQSQPGFGTLPAAWMMDDAQLGRAVRQVSRQSTRSLMHYGELGGYLPLRQHLKTKLRAMGIRCDVGQLIVTHGASEALHLVTMSTCGAGDTVLIDEPAPFLLIERLNATGIYQIGIPRLADGPDLDALRKACERHRPRTYFCSGVLHNPTSTSLSAHRAFKLLQLAQEFDLQLVEDDSYGDLLAPDDAISRLATLDQLERVTYVGSFSKTLAPGLRVGYIASPAAQVPRLLSHKSLSYVSHGELAQRIVYQVLVDGKYRHHCERLRQALDERRQTLAGELIRLGATLPFATDCGMYLWADFGSQVDMTRISDRLANEGHVLAPGSAFALDDKHKSCMRFNVANSHPSPALVALDRALQRVA